MTHNAAIKSKKFKCDEIEKKSLKIFKNLINQEI